MRIVSRDELLQLPGGTIYSEYDPVIIYGLFMKLETIYDGETPIDFYLTRLPSIDTAALEHAGQSGEEVPLEFESKERDGAFRRDGGYAVWGLDDIQGLIGILSRAVITLTAGGGEWWQTSILKCQR